MAIIARFQTKSPSILTGIFAVDIHHRSREGRMRYAPTHLRLKQWIYFHCTNETVLTSNHYRTISNEKPLNWNRHVHCIHAISLTPWAYAIRPYNFALNFLIDIPFVVCINLPLSFYHPFMETRGLIKRQKSHAGHETFVIIENLSFNPKYWKKPWT